MKFFDKLFSFIEKVENFFSGLIILILGILSAAISVFTFMEGQIITGIVTAITAIVLIPMGFFAFTPDKEENKDSDKNN